MRFEIEFLKINPERVITKRKRFCLICRYSCLLLPENPELLSPDCPVEILKSAEGADL